MREVLKGLGKILAGVLVVAAFSYGIYGMGTYAYPLSSDNFRGALKSRVADKTEVYLNGAAHSYEKGNYDEARKALELAVEQLVDKDGKFHPSEKWKVERVHFLLGKCYQRQKKFDKAIKEYEDTLRLNPDHYPAKYNLEMLKRSGGGGGSDGTGGGDSGGVKPGGKTKPKI